MNIYKKAKKFERMYKTQREMRLHYEELFEAGINEIKFKKLSVDFLLSVLDEIETITTDNIVKGIVKNTTERHALDKLIHNRQIFGDHSKFGLYS